MTTTTNLANERGSSSFEQSEWRMDGAAPFGEKARAACAELDVLDIELRQRSLGDYLKGSRGKPYLHALHKHELSQHDYSQVVASVPTLPRLGALYLHFPYCTKHCLHCHYYKTTGGTPSDWANFPRHLIGELELLRRAFGKVVFEADTIHFGGGTPSLITRQPWMSMMRDLANLVDLDAAREIAVEVDPADLTPEHLDFWALSGVNRISLGVQSFDDGVLRMMNREHGGAQAIAAIESVQRSEIINLNVDLMYGMPHRSLATWQSDLDVIARLRPQSVTCYATRPDPQNQLDLARAFPSAKERLVAHQMSIGQLLSIGYIQYSPNQFILDYAGACLAKNNRNRCQDVLGVGPHAHSILQGWFYENMSGVRAYVEHMGQGQLCSVKGARISFDEAKRRYLQFGVKLSGLRKPVLDNGVSRSSYAALFDGDVLDDFRRPLEVLTELDLVADLRCDRVALTHAGVLLSDDVVKAFGAAEH